MNRTLIGNKARFQLERNAWIEIARMESEPRLSALDVCNKALESISGRVPFPSFGTGLQRHRDWEAPDGWSPYRDA